MIDSFILREGTDYGHTEIDLAAKRRAVMDQLVKGTAEIVYDEGTGTLDIQTT